MYEVLREKDFVVIVNNDTGEDYCFIDNEATLKRFVLESGWNSVEKFEEEVGKKRDQIIGHAICYCALDFWTADNEEWFDSMDINRIEAVFNSFVLKTNEGSFSDIKLTLFSILNGICSKRVIAEISGLSDDICTTDTKEYLSKLAYQVLHHYGIILQKKYSDRYFF